MHVVALAGGIGGARFLTGLKAALAEDYPDHPDATITVIANTGDDLTLHGLRICPDLDTVMYTLGGGIEPSQGWGRNQETWSAKAELAAYGVGPDWFGLGDRDLATHLVRTQRLAAGQSLSEVTAALCERWQPGVRLLPMSDEQVETHVVVEQDGEQRTMHFQEWWLRWQAKLPAVRFLQLGVESAAPAPGVLAAIATADVVVLAPSNPVVSVGTILGVPGIRAALTAGPAPVVGLSPIVGGAPVRGMADACLSAIGVPATAEAVGRHYGARSQDGLLDGWLVDSRDSATIPGVAVLPRPLLMTDVAATAAMARAALELVR